MSALHYLLLSTTLFFAISTSNLECVLEGLNSFRRIKHPNQTSSSLKKSESHSFSDGFAKFTVFLKSLGDSSKGKNGKFEPMSTEAVIQEVIAKESHVLNDKQRRFCDQICVPFVSEIGIERSVAVYFCERIVLMKNETVKFLLDNSDVAGSYFGTAFQASAVHLPVNFFAAKPNQKDSIVNSFTEKQKLVTALKAKFDQSASLMATEIEKFNKVNIQETLIMNFKQKLNLEKTLKDLLGKDTKNLKEKIIKLTLAFNINLDGNKVNIVKRFQSALSTYSGALKEDVNSQAFRSLLDKTIVFVDGQYPSHSIQIENYILAQCFQTLTKFGVTQPVHTCRAIVQPAFVFEENHKKLFDNALESVKFFKMVNHFVQKNLMAFASNKLTSANKVSILIRKDITEQLLKIGQHMEIITMIYPDVSGDIFAPLVWDLQKFVARYDKQAFDILRVNGAFERYAKELLTNVHASSKIFELVSGLKKTLANHFKTDKTDMQAGEFREKLVEECERQMTDVRLNVCKKSVWTFKIEKNLLAIRHSNAVFKYIITLLKEFLDRQDTLLNDEMTLTSAAIETLRKILKTTEDEFESFNKKLTGTLKNLKDKKLSRLFIQAKLVNLDLKKNFAEDIWPVCLAWTEHHANYIAAFNLKDQSFEELADQLTEAIRNHFSEDLKVARMSDSFHELNNSLEHITFNPDSKAIQDLKSYIYPLIKHYDSLPNNIKNELAKCVLSEEEFNHKLAECNAKNQRSCITINPFLATPTCPTGYVSDSLGNCIESCPEGFGPSNQEFCNKPQVTFVGAVLGKVVTDAATKCPHNFTKIGLMCVPRCPSGWQDHGKACKRPVIKHNINHDILLIK
jgi:hypothetical protein